jgi:PsbP
MTMRMSILLLLLLLLVTQTRIVVVTSFAPVKSISPSPILHLPNVHWMSTTNSNEDNNTELASSTYQYGNRRKLLQSTVSTTGLFVSAVATGLGGSVATVASANAAMAQPQNLQTYFDEKFGFTIDLPSRWTKMNDVTSLSDRRTIVVYTDPSDSATSLLIVYTPIRDDFTSLNSFGSVDQVAAQTVLPKGNLLDEENDTTAKMISSISTKQSYMFDYLQKVPAVQQPLTHYRTIFTLGKAQENTAGAVLVTITLQTPESQYAATRSTFDTIIDSYQRV